jgi:hypothetical protein
MKKIVLTLVVCGLARAGTEYAEQSVKQAPPSPEWYADNEFNVNLWGTYAFTQTDNDPNLDLFSLIRSARLPGLHVTFPGPDYGRFDTYLGGDHAWGGGVDIKYFFHRYFGIGIEGFALDAKRNGFDIRQAFQASNFFTGDIIDQGIVGGKTTEERVVGSVLGTLTLRYPVAHSRLSPYVWVGGGAIFGGGEKTGSI